MTAILSFDTSQDTCSVALVYNNQYFYAFEEAAQSHTKRLLPMIDDLLKQADCEKSELKAIAFSQGPGSFTGLRIGFGVAQGLALGLDIPVLAISSLQAQALGAVRQLNLQDGQSLVASIDARMREIYVCAYRLENGQLNPLEAEQVIAPEDYLSQTADLKPSQTLVVGSGLEYECFSEQDWLSQHADLGIDARDILTLALTKFNAGLAQSIFDVQPVYLRDTVSWQKRQRKRPQ